MTIPFSSVLLSKANNNETTDSLEDTTPTIVTVDGADFVKRILNGESKYALTITKITEKRT